MKKKLLIIFTPLLLGFLFSLLLDIPSNFYKISVPYFTPKPIVFIIVWTILYFLMGISSYMIYTYKNELSKKAIYFYIVSLVLNLLWTVIFFKLHLFLLSFILIIFIFVFILLTIIYYFKINSLAAIMQIPYLLWIIFAGFLNFYVYMIN